MENNKEKNIMNLRQMTFMLIGSMMGIGVLSLPNDLVKYCKQDAWISSIIGGIYPLYMILIASYIHKKHPKEDILELSKKYYGKIFGNILNAIFITYFLILSAQIASGTSNVLRIYMINFLNNFQALLIIILASAYVVYRGIDCVVRTNTIIFALTIVIVSILLVGLKDADILNIMPVFQSGFANIAVGAKETMFSYTGVEIIFIIHSFLRNEKSIMKNSIKAVIFTIIVYSLVILITILYLGIPNINKFLWSMVTITESIEVPIINSFRYIFMVLWSMVMFKTIANSYYMTAYGIKKFVPKVTIQNIVMILYPIVLIIAMLYGVPVKRREFLEKYIPISILFNLFYVSTIALFVKFKK